MEMFYKIRTCELAANICIKFYLRLQTEFDKSVFDIFKFFLFYCKI